MVSIKITGRQAINLYNFLGGLAKVSEPDRTKQGKLRYRLSKLLRVNESGEFESLDVLRSEIRYTIADVMNGIPKEFLEKPVMGPDGHTMMAVSYTRDSLNQVLGEFKLEPQDIDTLFRIFRARLAANDTSGAHAEALYKLAGMFPNMQKAIEISQSSIPDEPGFVEPPPEELHGAS